MAKPQWNSNYLFQPGFSLVELIIVIIILGIVSLVAIPRFTDNTGFSEFAMQQRLQGALKTLQLKSMQDTSGDYCYRMLIDTTNDEIGPSVADYRTSTQTASCQTTIAANAPEAMLFSESELSALSLQVSTSDNGSSFSRVDFDSLGRPTTDIGTCTNGCQINLIGQDTTTVCINAQGFIYDC